MARPPMYLQRARGPSKELAADPRIKEAYLGE
jgi:ABC-type branched-subunit amino acid transport system ATPase component